MRAVWLCDASILSLVCFANILWISLIHSHFYTCRADIKIYNHADTYCIDASKIADGKEYVYTDGIPGYNLMGKNSAKNLKPYRSPGEIVNEYIKFVLMHLNKNPTKTRSKEFLFDLVKHDNLQPYYNVVDLINEFQLLGHSIEKHEKVEYLESLLVRIENKKINNFEESEQLSYKKVLNYLYTTVASKISYINGDINTGAVWNLKSYLEQAKKEIKGLKAANREIYIARRSMMYTSSLNDKIKMATNAIETEIMPKIDLNFEQFNSNITRLLKENKHLQSTLETDKQKLKEMAVEARKQCVFSIIKVIGAGLLPLGPPAAVVGGIAIAGASVADHALVDKEKLNPTIHKLKIENISDRTREEVIKFVAVLNKKLELINNSINLIEGDDEISKEELEVFKKDFSKLKDDKPISQLVASITEIQTWLSKKCTEKQDKLWHTTMSDDKRNKCEVQLKNLETAKKWVTITMLPFSVTGEILKGVDTAKNISNSIEEISNDLKALRQSESDIYNIMYPLFRSINDSFVTMEKNMKNKSESEQDLMNWITKTSFDDVKEIIKQMTKGYTMQADFMNCFKKITDGIDIMTKINKQVAKYQRECEFAVYISDLSSVNISSIENGALKNAIKKLDSKMISSLVLERHGKVLDAYKQHYFPFAPKLIPDYELPESLTLEDDPQNIEDEAVKKIEEIIAAEAKWSSSLKKYDNDLICMNSLLIEKRSPYHQPFYVWKSKDYAEEFARFLRGEEIVLNADVTKGHQWINASAVKFKEIGIYFRFADQNIRERFYETFQNFLVSMTMAGKNYYRCQNKFYSTVVNDEITFTFTVNINGSQNSLNNAYMEIKNKSTEYFLSPYTMWRIKLDGSLLPNSTHFDSLKEFQFEEMCMDLVGKGRYLKHGKFLNEVCNEDRLQKMYDIEKI